MSNKICKIDVKAIFLPLTLNMIEKLINTYYSMSNQ